MNTADRKSEFLTVRFTPAQVRLLRRCAEEEGVTLAGWVRRLVLRRAVRRLVREAGIAEQQ